MTATAQAVPGEVMSLTERELMRRMIIRLMPIVTFIYLIAIIDRSNIGFAKLQMAQDLHMSEAVYGFGASLFFIGYLVFEIPSTLAVHHFGARGWLARIMLSWGIVTILLAFAYSTTTFYILRLLLGIAEAGCYPGLIYFITLWFPARYRVGVVGVLTLGSAFGNMLGSLLGGLLLDLNGTLGLAGWQWVFLATGAPAVIMCFLILLFLPSTPEQARFLSAQEKGWLMAQIKREQSAPRGHGSFWSVIADPRVLFFSLIYALILCALYGVIYWIPTVVKGFGVTGAQNGLLSAVPRGIAAAALMIIPRRLKHESETLLAMGIMALTGLLAFLASTLVGENWMRFLGMANREPMHIAAAAVLLVAAVAPLFGRAGCNRHRSHQHARQSRRLHCAEHDALRGASHRQRRGRHAGSRRLRRRGRPVGCGHAPCRRWRACQDLTSRRRAVAALACAGQHCVCLSPGSCVCCTNGRSRMRPLTPRAKGYAPCASTRSTMLGCF